MCLKYSVNVSKKGEHETLKFVDVDGVNNHKRKTIVLAGYLSSEPDR